MGNKEDFKRITQKEKDSLESAKNLIKRTMETL
jgi:hypothetical protein